MNTIMKWNGDWLLSYIIGWLKDAFILYGLEKQLARNKNSIQNNIL